MDKKILLKMENRILYNAIKTPDGTILHSKYRHDYVSHNDANGLYYANDGGNDYTKRLMYKDDFEDLTVYDDGEHTTRREYVVWGVNFDKDMNRLPETEFRLVKDLTTSHIEAIIETQKQLDSFYLEVLKNELDYRDTMCL